MFNLELDKAITEIKRQSCKNVVIQLPDGLKARAQEAVDTIEKETGANVYIWLASCFGACDLPAGLKALNIDLMIQWGHNTYHKTPDNW